jgi:deazaflavin-dependent oxidoreductase (nitroreductase family)
VVPAGLPLAAGRLPAYRCMCNYMTGGPEPPPPTPENLLDATIRNALGHSQVIDITTTGRHSGEARRIEIFIHNLGGRLVISGMPMPGRTRAWLHNVEADPALTIHLKGPYAAADVEATARVITDPVERRELLTGVAANWRRTDLDAMVDHSPLIEVTVPGFPA